MKKPMASGGFPLRKFFSNQPEALNGLSNEDLASYHEAILVEKEFMTKTMGVNVNNVQMFALTERMENMRTETSAFKCESKTNFLNFMGYAK